MLLHCASLHQLVEALRNSVDARDPLLYRHSRDVVEVACLLARVMGPAPEKIDIIHIAGHLHDIGKLGVPDVLLNKRGALNEDEWCWIRLHPEIGAEIVRPVPALNRPEGVANIIFHNPRTFRWKGVPRGPGLRRYPSGARIVASADNLSALLRNRSYRFGCSLDAACAEIHYCSGTQFDPAVVEALERNRDMVGRSLEERDDFFRYNGVVSRAPAGIALMA